MNLNQYFGKQYPIGSLLSMVYQGDLITLADGSVWLCSITTAPFAYTSEYESCVDICTSPHPLMAGWSSGLWLLPSTNFCIAYKPASNFICTAAVYGSNFAGVTAYYYTHNGTSWTKRSFPNPGINYTCIQYTAGKFFAVAAGVTTSGVIYSSDGMSWSTVNGISLTPQDVISNGGNNIIIIGTSTTLASSLDAGATWTGISCTIPFNGQCNGVGVGTWNAGAGLFILSTTTAGVYQTSPTGDVWTLRNGQTTYSAYTSYFTSGTKYASNATITIAVGNNGFFATTTDGLNWSNHGLISPTLPYNGVANQVYHDGIRFIVRYTNRIFYSTNGISWTEGSRIGGGTLVTPQSNGLLFLFPYLTNGVVSKMLKILDVTLTTPQTVIYPNIAAAYASLMSYIRIK